MKKLAGILLFCIGCTTAPKPAIIHVSLADSSHSVKIKGIAYPIISEINRDSVTDVWQSLIPVYRMPADTDMKDYQTAQPGKYALKDSAVVFTPDTPFVKGQSYFVRYYQFSEANSTMDFLRGKKKLGKAKYADYGF